MKNPKMGKERHGTFMKTNVASNIFWGQLSRVFLWFLTARNSLERMGDAEISWDSVTSKKDSRQAETVTDPLDVSSGETRI